jgi:hypothetical protein
MKQQDLKAQLTENLEVAEWEWLIPHAKRDAVIVVADSLDLLDVGTKSVSDDLLEMKKWVEKELIAKPSAPQISEWNSDRTKRFRTLIVQPYVFVQEINPK